MNKAIPSLAATALLSAAISGAATSAGAVDMVQRWFGGGQCWARTYDAAHMRRNPDQQVSRIWVGGRAGDARASAGEVALGLAIAGRTGGYGGMAVCRETQAGLACGVEGDGGRFRLSTAGSELRLTVADRLVLEGSNDFSPELGGPADRVFILRRAAAGACRAG